MRFDQHLRAEVIDAIERVAEEMKDWEVLPRVSQQEQDRIREVIQTFEHTVTPPPELTVGGVDGSGDFPSVAYSDSFVYFTIARATAYRADATSGLSEYELGLKTLVQFTWLAEDNARRRASLDRAFAELAGTGIRDVVAQSDYRDLKATHSRKSTSVDDLVEQLIRPHAADAPNLGVQLRSTGELGAALRLIRSEVCPKYVLTDGTLSLPLVTRKDVSLFFEHLKRLCCVEATAKQVALLAVSKSHGLPSIEVVERLAREKMGLADGKVAEHWFLRIPTSEIDGWELSLIEGRTIPPQGAMTFIVRFHRSAPVLRIDMDSSFWRHHVRADDDATTLQRERKIFQDLDHACHDQRCFGYPYPIKAGHDRASLTEPERVAFRKQIIDAAVKTGLKRSLFRDAATATGHQ